MLQSGERETEILLGNKQLLGVFFVVAALLGVAFTGGYMVGRGSSLKKAPVAAAAVDTNNSETTATAAQPGGETHSVPPDDSSAALNADSAVHHSRKPEDVLGSRHKKQTVAPAETTETASARPDSFVPQSGQEFLQVTSVTRDHAMAVAAVLRKKGFHAHAVPKPGQANLYRVIVGPIRSAGELSSTRDSLRKTGFNQVLVQRYQE